MKIGIITLHNSYSYGACLQAYATYLAVKELGHEVYMIDYVNDYEQEQNRIISFKKGQCLKKSIIRTFENIVLCKHRNMKRAFFEFHNIYKKTRRCVGKDDLDREKFDCLISGSDQLWNPDIFGEIDTTFFLDFGDCQCKRIAYAASAGSHVFTTEEVKLIKPLLKKYNAISVREEKLKKQVDKIIGRDTTVVIDPTFLIENTEWKKISSFKKRENYILLYMIGVPYDEYKSRYAPIVEYYRNELKLPVYAVTPFSFIKFSGADLNLNTITPNNLIGAINDASLIVTSSFHGVAFSINLNKRFVALETGNPTRVKHLLSMVGLSDRLMCSFELDKCRSLLQNIDYTDVNRFIRMKRTESLNWLKESICHE